MHAEYEMAKSGRYKEKAMDFLKSSWQATALKSLADRVRPSWLLRADHIRMHAAPASQLKDHPAWSCYAW